MILDRNVCPPKQLTVICKRGVARVAPARDFKFTSLTNQNAGDIMSEFIKGLSVFPVATWTVLPPMASISYPVLDVIIWKAGNESPASTVCWQFAVDLKKNALFHVLKRYF